MLTHLISGHCRTYTPGLAIILWELVVPAKEGRYMKAIVGQIMWLQVCSGLALAIPWIVLLPGLHDITRSYIPDQ